MIALVTDSNAQLSPELTAELGVDVVPLVISIDGKDYAEGVDLGADDFYEMLAGDSHEISTSQPSPGRFLETYLTAAQRGATEILSVHIGAEHSGTVNSATVASRRAPAESVIAQVYRPDEHDAVRPHFPYPTDVGPERVRSLDAVKGVGAVLFAQF